MMKKYRPYFIEWYVAIRKRQEGLLNPKGKFYVLNNPKDGWCADPFIFEYKGHDYIFAEKYSFRKQKGEIVFAKISKGRVSEWETAIEERFHMSYPFIWEDEKGIHICAETNEAQTIMIYTAMEFPYKWVVDKVIWNKDSYADTTILLDSKNEPKWFFTYGCTGLVNGKLYYGKFDKEQNVMGKPRRITRDATVARPGGAFIEEGTKIYRVAQDCSESYGKRISICEVKEISDRTYSEEMLFQREYSDIEVNKKLNVIGMHTYNRNSKYEVIDLRTKRFNIINFFYYQAKLLSKQ